MTGVTFDWISTDDGANGNAIAMFHGGVATGVSAGVMHVTASASAVTSLPVALTVLAPSPTLASGATVSLCNRTGAVNHRDQRIGARSPGEQ